MRLRLEQRKHLEQRLQRHADRAAPGFSGDGGGADRERALIALDRALAGAEGHAGARAARADPHGCAA